MKIMEIKEKFGLLDYFYIIWNSLSEDLLNVHVGQIVNTQGCYKKNWNGRMCWKCFNSQEPKSSIWHWIVCRLKVKVTPLPPNSSHQFHYTWHLWKLFSD
jgi:hypothetical protein